MTSNTSSPGVDRKEAKRKWSWIPGSKPTPKSAARQAADQADREISNAKTARPNSHQFQATIKPPPISPDPGPPIPATSNIQRSSLNSEPMNQLNKLSLEESRGIETSSAQLPAETRISVKRGFDEPEAASEDRARKFRHSSAFPLRRGSPPIKRDEENADQTPDPAPPKVQSGNTPESHPRPSPPDVRSDSEGYDNSPSHDKRRFQNNAGIRPDDEGGGDVEADTSMLLQPETRPITQEQLVNEVKGIYAGLVMVEKKCVEICQQQSKTTNKLSNEQWQALIALHRTLLHEHHDFFLASQHPSASPALRRLATKYAMPARMWRHGIHSFLELLRHRLPDSLDHMLAFVYLAYSMMALLMESVPSFVETWIECLGDLARYRMAIEEADLRDREIWANVARMWYNKAADRSPNVGRIQHHLAVLARPNIVQQLFYYSKALVSVVPFVNARESVMLLYTPFLEKSEMTYQKYPVTESSLVTAFGILFTRGKIIDFQQHADQFISSLDPHISRTSSKFKVQGPEICSSLIAGLLDVGNDDNTLWKLFRSHMDSVKARQAQFTDGDTSQAKELQTLDPRLKDTMRKEYWASVNSQTTGVRSSSSGLSTIESPDDKFTSSDQVASFAGPLLYKTTQTVAQRIGDKNSVPYMHMLLAFLWSLSYVPEGLIHVEHTIPWAAVVTWLNTLGRSGIGEDCFEDEEFLQPLSGLGRQLPEDFPMRGLVWSQHYFVPDFFVGDVIDEDERLLELPSHAAPRAERVLWLAARLASLKRHIILNVETKQFAATDFALSLASDASSLAHTFASAQVQRSSVDDIKMSEC